LTVWLNVPFSATVGWLFVSLERVGEKSSNPFEWAPTMSQFPWLLQRRQKIYRKVRIDFTDRANTMIKRGTPFHILLTALSDITLQMAIKRASRVATVRLH